MDKSDALNIAKQFAEIIVSEFNPTKVFLYGSYASGNWKPESDIDIAVIVKALKRDYIQSLYLLYKLRRQVDIIIEPTLFIEGKDPSGLLEYILKNGELVYSVN